MKRKKCKIDFRLQKEKSHLWVIQHFDMDQQQCTFHPSSVLVIPSFPLPYCTETRGMTSLPHRSPGWHDHHQAEGVDSGIWRSWWSLLESAAWWLGMRPRELCHEWGNGGDNEVAWIKGQQAWDFLVVRARRFFYVVKGTSFVKEI